MNYEERKKLVNRICSRESYYVIEHKDKSYRVKVSDPTINLINESESVYQHELNESVLDGCPTQNEIKMLMVKTGQWSSAQESLIESFSEELIKFKEVFNKLRYKKTQQAQVKSNIIKLENRIKELNDKRTQLDHITAEHMASRKQKLFLIKNSTVVIDASDFTMCDDFLYKVMSVYFADFYAEDSVIRKLARTDPWRGIWSLSKTGGNSLFNHSASEMTALQQRLVTWSKIYDYAYEHHEYPGEEVISDDFMFDAWYVSQTEKAIESRKNPSKAQRQSRIDRTPRLSRFGAGEIFIPSDPDSVSDVYNMNSSQSKGIIQGRQKVISQKGRAKQIDLPDVSMDIKTSQNRSRIKNG